MVSFRFCDKHHKSSIFSSSAPHLWLETYGHVRNLMFLYSNQVHVDLWVGLDTNGSYSVCILEFWTLKPRSICLDTNRLAVQFIIICQSPISVFTSLFLCYVLRYNFNCASHYVCAFKRCIVFCSTYHRNRMVSLLFIAYGNFDLM